MTPHDRFRVAELGHPALHARDRAVRAGAPGVGPDENRRDGVGARR